MKVMVAIELGERSVVETITTKEDFRGDYRSAVGECAMRVELATYGPQHSDQYVFDEPIQMKPGI